MQNTLNEDIIINQKKLLDFKQLLEISSITENEKNALKFAIEFLDGKHYTNLSSRSFLLKGDPGVGKTYLVEKVLDIFNIPIIFHGCANLKHPNLIYCKSLDEVIKEIKNCERFIVFLDDLNYIFKENKKSFA